MTDINIRNFISKKIADAFGELAEKLADELAEKYGEDMPTGALTFEMMSAQLHLDIKWQEYCNNKESEHRGA